MDGGREGGREEINGKWKRNKEGVRKIWEREFCVRTSDGLLALV
jgi:hypothetical protein